MANYIITVQPDSRQLCPPHYFPLGRTCRQLINTPRRAQSTMVPLIAFHSDTFFNFRLSSLYQPSVRLFRYPGGVWMREGVIKINYENNNSGVIIISFLIFQQSDRFLYFQQIIGVIHLVSLSVDVFSALQYSFLFFLV